MSLLRRLSYALDLETAAQSTTTPGPRVLQNSDSSSENEETDGALGFDNNLVEPFAKTVKEAIGWEEVDEMPRKVRRYFPNIKKHPEAFLFINELDKLL